MGIINAVILIGMASVAHKIATAMRIPRHFRADYEHPLGRLDEKIKRATTYRLFFHDGDQRKHNDCNDGT